MQRSERALGGVIAPVCCGVGMPMQQLGMREASKMEDFELCSIEQICHLLCDLVSCAFLSRK